MTASATTALGRTAPVRVRATGLACLAVGLGAVAAGQLGPGPVAVALERVAGLLTTGTLLVSVCCVSSPGPRLSPTAARVLSRAVAPACLWALACLADLAVQLRTVTGMSPVEVLLRLAGGQAGWWWGSPGVQPALLEALVTAVLATSLLSRSTRPARAVVRPPGHAAAGAVLVVALLAVLPLTTTGHALHADHPRLAALALTAHVAAVTCWVGGLASLVVHRKLLAAEMPAAAQRSSRGAAAAVVLLVVSGTAFVVLTVPDPVTALPGSPWAVLVAAKAALLVPVLALGAVHRRRTLPALRRGDPRSFVRFAGAELLLLTAALVLAAVLAATPDP